MKRSHAFWGALLVVLGVSLLAHNELRALEQLKTLSGIAIGAGAMLLGFAVVVRQRMAAWVAALLAGMCIGFYVGAAIAAPQKVWSDRVHLSCNVSDFDDDHVISDDTTSTGDQSLPPDTAGRRSQPVY
jgi:hypothetical protein